MKPPRRILFLIAVSLGIILSSCTIVVQPPTHTSSWHTLATGNTGWLNCAGWTVNGDYFKQYFSLSTPATVEITVWASNDDIETPSGFDIYLMTPSQYNSFVQQSGSSSLYSWDLTQYWNSYSYEYYIDFSTGLPAGNYYLVFSNDYTHFMQGEWDKASYQIDAYY